MGWRGRPWRGDGNPQGKGSSLPRQPGALGLGRRKAGAGPRILASHQVRARPFAEERSEGQGAAVKYEGAGQGGDMGPS